jgi:hypothetical protein
MSVVNSKPDFSRLWPFETRPPNGDRASNSDGSASELRRRNRLVERRI